MLFYMLVKHFPLVCKTAQTYSYWLDGFFMHQISSSLLIDFSVERNSKLNGKKFICLCIFSQSISTFQGENICFGKWNTLEQCYCTYYWKAFANKPTVEWHAISLALIGCYSEIAEPWMLASAEMLRRFGLTHLFVALATAFLTKKRNPAA